VVKRKDLGVSHRTCKFTLELLVAPLELTLTIQKVINRSEGLEASVGTTKLACDTSQSVIGQCTVKVLVEYTRQFIDHIGIKMAFFEVFVGNYRSNNWCKKEVSKPWPWQISIVTIQGMIQRIDYKS
jgi:hypothetical protein